jgi:excisionase family DNA binding protein
MTEGLPVRADETVYTPEEIAEYAKCSASFVRREIRRGRLRGHKLGGKLLRVKGKEVHQWLEKQCSNSASIPSVASGSEVSGVSSGGTAPAGRDMLSTLASITLSERRRQR